MPTEGRRDAGKLKEAPRKAVVARVVGITARELGAKRKVTYLTLGCC